MNAYVCLLRGINVSGKHLLKMQELRKLCTGLGLKHVSTYLQSGNVFFQSDIPHRTELTRILESELLDLLGYSISCVLLKPSELEDMLEGNPFASEDPDSLAQLYYVVWKDPPESDIEKRLAAKHFPDERWVIGRHCIYLKCLKGYGRAKLNNNMLERLGNMTATTRNHRTITKLVALAHPDRTVS